MLARLARSSHRLVVASSKPRGSYRVSNRFNSSSAPAKETPAAPLSAPSQAQAKTGNVFFDNPGVFASIFIVSLGSYFYYNKRGGDARVAAVEAIDEESIVSPREIRQLRDDNNITLDRFNALVGAAKARFPGGSRMTYDDFNELLLEHLFEDGEAVQWGHYWERVLKFLQAKHDPEKQGLDARVLLLTMSLGLKGQVKDRASSIFNIFADNGTMSIEDFTVCIAAMQDTFQLPSQYQVHKVQKYPFPEYEKLSGEHLAKRAVRRQSEEQKSKITSIDQATFNTLLKTKWLCAWGECMENKQRKKKKKKKKSAVQKGEDSASEVEELFAETEQRLARGRAVADSLDFIPAESFEGSKPGYVFTRRDKGLGYYPDPYSAADLAE